MLTRVSLRAPITASRERPDWSRTLPRPLTIPDVMTLRTLADVRKLLEHIPKEQRKLSTWQHIERTLQACAAGEDDPANINVALQLVLQVEGVPYKIC
jgi:hypothetical protein